MENEKEKRKIEFWVRWDTNLRAALKKNKPPIPFDNKVSVSVTFVTWADIEISRATDREDNDLGLLATRILAMLESYKYVEKIGKIVSLSIEKRECRTPGISFFMQEVE